MAMAMAAGERRGLRRLWRVFRWGAFRRLARTAAVALVAGSLALALAATVLYGLALLALEDLETTPPPMLAGAAQEARRVGRDGAFWSGDAPPLALGGHDAPLTLAWFSRQGTLITAAADGGVRWTDPGPAAALAGVDPLRPLKALLERGLWQPWLRPAARQALDLTAQVLPLHVPVTRRGHRGRVFRDCPECPELVELSPGQFWQGSPWTESGRDLDEGPRRLVTIGQPLAVGQYEVTFAEWDACVAGGGCGGYRPDDRGWGRGRRPVINVSWKDAQSYVQWLSDKTGQRYRLLSEAEWEYAARGGTTTPFWTGQTITPDQANYNGNYAYNGGPQGIYRERTVEVGSFPANRFGLYDVHGNVWEWVEGCWNDSYSDAPGDGRVWASDNCSSRVLRGGSWFYNPYIVRSAYRSRIDVDFRYNNNGFRVVRTVF